MPNNRKVTANDALRIALANPDIVVPPEALDALKQAKRSKYGNIKVSQQQQQQHYYYSYYRWLLS